MRKFLSLAIIIALLLGAVPLSAVRAEEGENVMASLSDSQRNSIGVLNYLAYLTKEIESQKGNRLYLEDAYSSLYNNIYMNAIDEVTLGQVKSLLTALFNFKMIATKRERLEYLYEQNQAQAICAAVPSPFDVKNLVQAGSWPMALVSVVSMAVNSITSYHSAKNEAELEYLQNGWDLDDEEAEVLHSGHLDSIEYMWQIIHDYDLPGDLAINEDDIDRFVSWKNNPNIVGRIQFLESNRSVFQGFGEYWLVLAESYYNNEDMAKCLEAVRSYEAYSTRIFRKDYHYARVLTLAIAAAHSEYPVAQYIPEAERFASRIVANCDQEDWLLRFFAAATYAELADMTSDSSWLKKAYDIALDNVNVLVQEQIANNKTYLADIKLETVPKGSSEAKKKEIETYNKGLQEARKTAVPPTSDALMLNCDLLFSLANRLEISPDEEARISGILFGHGDALFLNPFINDLYALYAASGISADNIDVSFDGKEIKIPAMYLTDETSISVGGLDSKTGQIFTIDDWVLKSVERKSPSDLGTFTATFTSSTASGFSYTEGSTVWINFNPAGDEHTADMQFSFNVVSKTDFLLPYLAFQRVQ